ncbi:MAG: hypothetical protein HY985_11625 [Magnetospirillum sp.]|nr:hypothetical protein [Magnetospirillum sp.]
MAQTPWQSENGRETREIALQGGVVVIEERKGEEVISHLEFDASGHGAVLCSWQLYSRMYAGLAVCGDGNDEWKAELFTALERMNEFIVANTLTAVSKNDLQNEISNKVMVIERSMDGKYGARREMVCGLLHNYSRFFH